MPSISKQPNRAYPSIPEITEDLESHTIALQAIKDALQTHERRDNNFLKSFIRFEELVELGIIDNLGEFALSIPLYTVANVTTTRIYDADATTLAELADVVGTLIADLKSISLALSS